jgi:hypothetical protein
MKDAIDLIERLRAQGVELSSRGITSGLEAREMP